VTEVVTYALFYQGKISHCKEVAFNPVFFLMGIYLDGAAAVEANRAFLSPAHSPVPNNTHKGYN